MSSAFALYAIPYPDSVLATIMNRTEEERHFAAPTRRHGHHVNFDMSGLASMRAGGGRLASSPVPSETSGHHDPPIITQQDYTREPVVDATGVGPDNSSDLPSIPLHQSEGENFSVSTYHSVEDEDAHTVRADPSQDDASIARTHQSSEDAISDTSGYHQAPAHQHEPGQPVESDTSGHHVPSHSIRMGGKRRGWDDVSNTQAPHYILVPPPQRPYVHRPNQVVALDMPPKDSSAPSGSDSRDEPNEPDDQFPGIFALQLHTKALVSELREFKPGLARSTWDTLRDKFRRKKYDEELASAASSDTSYGSKRRFCISFAEVQRMRIRKLQCELVRHVVHMRREGTESKDWEETMKEYSMPPPPLGKVWVESQ